MLLWIDTETTGLDPEHCELLEVALVITDNELREIDAAEWVLPYQRMPYDGLAQVVVDMHTKNGLWEECAVQFPAELAPLRRAAIAIEILERMRRWTSAKNGPICGSTIAFDRAFLHKHMPTVEAHFSHRNLDVSVLGELAKLWAPEVYEKRPKGGGHRALPDIRGSIDLLKYWRQHLPEVLR